MMVITTSKAKNRAKELNKKILKQYWSVLYPYEQYVKPLVEDGKAEKPNGRN